MEGFSIKECSSVGLPNSSKAHLNFHLNFYIYYQLPRTRFITTSSNLQPLYSHSPQSAYHKAMSTHSEMTENLPANEYSDSESMSGSDSKYVISLFYMYHR